MQHNFEDKLLDIFILIEENKAESTIKAINLFKALWDKETGESISKKRANEEMLKSYKKYIS